jgi:AcrR family transcriptional regulator
VGKDTQARILDAADQVFVRRGADGARMQEIADEAGVNKALLHYYFRTKDQLAHAVFLRIASSFLPVLIRIMGSEAPLDAKVDEAVDSYLTRLSRHPYLAGYIVSEASHHPERVLSAYAGETGKAMQVMIRRLRKQIEAEAAAGRMAAVTAEQFLVTLAASCFMPFAMRPVVGALFAPGSRGFERFIARRRKELPSFLKRALRP